MTKLITTAFLIIVAAGVYLYWAKGDNRGPIGDPVFSQSPDVSTSVAPTAFTNGTYQLNAASSSMSWQGSRPLVKGYFDNGIISIKEGVTTVASGSVTGGSVVVDMQSISVKSTGRGSGESMLAKDLKSSNFFDSEKYPTSTFTLSKLTSTGGSNYNVEGSLTVKGITNPVAFAATVTQNGDTLTMTAKDTQLDRTKWGIKYNSGNFFKDLVAEKIVDDMFMINFTAVGQLKK